MGHFLDPNLKVESGGPEKGDVSTNSRPLYSAPRRKTDGVEVQRRFPSGFSCQVHKHAARSNGSSPLAVWARRQWMGRRCTLQTQRGPKKVG